MLAKMSPSQLAGQRVVWSYSGLTPPADLVRAIRHGEVGGIIFFGDNISSEPQIASVIRQLQADNRSPRNPVHSPLLLMTDQEGGDGVLGIKRLPGCAVPVRAPDRPVRRRRRRSDIGRPGAAANLHGVGMNVNLAPVLDVYRAPGDFIDQLGRSYSMNPYSVGALGADFIRAQQHGHVAATVKHFPGLGAAPAGLNTDNQPVTIGDSAWTIRHVDERPYAAAFKAGAKLAMVSWAVYPHLDHSPAGLSAKIISGELRHRLGFRGVTITDAIGAGALQAYGSWAHRSELAARAGMDLVLCSGTIERGGPSCASGIASGYRDGQLSKPAFRIAVAQILALRASLPG